MDPRDALPHVTLYTKLNTECDQLVTMAIGRNGVARSIGHVFCELHLRERTDIQTETEKQAYSSQYFAPFPRCGLFVHVLLEY